MQKYNGNTFEYLYDENQNLIKTITIEKLSNGKTQTAIEQYDYDCFGNIIKYINADGIIFEFERDSRGNLLKYKKNGSILISFNYNDFGLVTKIQELIDDYDNLYKIHYPLFG